MLHSNMHVCNINLVTYQYLHLPKTTGTTLLSFISLFLLLWSGSRTAKLCNELRLTTNIDEAQSPSTILIKPISYKEQSRAKGIDIDNFIPYPLNNSLIVYISKSGINGGIEYVTYDKFPATIYTTDNPAKFQSIKDIEARGNSLQNGFRPRHNTPQ